MMGVGRGFHGHHHETRRYPTQGTVSWFGVGFREIVDFSGMSVIS